MGWVPVIGLVQYRDTLILAKTSDLELTMMRCKVQKLVRVFYRVDRTTDTNLRRCGWILLTTFSLGPLHWLQGRLER